jgi:hypothetical protein
MSDPSNSSAPRPYQDAVFDEFVHGSSRFWAMLWERQSGKSTTMADFALYEMLTRPNHTVIYASASLLLAQELPIKTALRAAQTVQQVIEGDATRLKHFADTAQSIINAASLSDSGTGVPPVSAPPHPYIGLAARLIAHAQSKKEILCRETANWDEAPLWTPPDTSSLWPPIQPALNTTSKMEFKTFDSLHDREIKKYTAADFADLFRQQRLEFRVYYSATSYSRTKVIAPNIATARSWSRTVLLDEVAFIRNFRELMTALLPVITTDKQFKLILATTPPEFDDTHHSFELLAPPPGLKFEPRAEGNWYTSENDVRVHRADAFDTALAGKKIYDLKTGAVITPEEAFTRAPNKDGHRIAHWLTWMAGGRAACDLLKLRVAQERGIGQCQNFQINSDADMVTALNWLHSALGGNPPHPNPLPQWGEGDAAFPRSVGGHRPPLQKTVKIGLGFDVATTTKGKSNPSVLSIMEEHGPEWIVRARFIWKTRDPETANQRIHSILDVLERCGARPRALAQDATNEKYYGEQIRTRFRRQVPVILVVASESVQKPGLDKPTNWKEYLGNQLVAKLDDNNLTLPADDYTRADYRLVMKDRGRFTCEPNDQGMHGDCFDADKLAGHALTQISSKRTIVAPMGPAPIWNPGLKHGG